MSAPVSTPLDVCLALSLDSIQRISSADFLTFCLSVPVCPSVCLSVSLCLSISAKDKGEKKLFGFSFTPLMREDGTTLSDDSHELYVYKVRTCLLVFLFYQSIAINSKTFIDIDN